MNELPKDISKRIEMDFGANHLEAVNLLKAFIADYPDAEEAERIWRCAVYVAKGNLEELMNALSLARIDSRDLIVWAEYEKGPNDSVRARNFNLPFDASSRTNS